MKTSAREDRLGQEEDWLRPGWRWVISLLVAFHLLAVFLPPLAFQARGPLGSSPSVQTLTAPVRGYGEFLYLNRGYAFFAPDAGPSHLIQAAIMDADGERVEQMYPDLRRHWPRLLYHRHFMLAEFLHDAYRPPLPPEAETLSALESDELEFWKTARTRYERIRQSIVDHLVATYPDRDVAIRRIEHAIPTFLDFNNEPMRLDDESLYRVLLDRAMEEIPASLPASSRSDATSDGPTSSADGSVTEEEAR